MTTVFKIRRKSDSLFSAGGNSPKFDSKGKTWKARNHVTSHMTQIGKQYYDPKTKDDYYRDCEVVEYEVVETEVRTTPVLEWVDDIVTKRLAQQKKFEINLLMIRKMEIEAELLEINKKIG